MGDVEAAEPLYPPTVGKQHPGAQRSTFLGILALHTVLEDSTINNWSSCSAAALALLIKSADVFIEGAKGLGRIERAFPEVVIGLTIVSIGTLPEILVTSTAASDIPNNLEIGDLAIENLRIHPRSNHAHLGGCRGVQGGQGPPVVAQARRLHHVLIHRSDDAFLVHREFTQSN